ncbi:MAG: hypothetical protein JNK64_31785 [Myxococcales bacterium]|nr:hypothetical protein [Myxococcales bacterium]
MATGRGARIGLAGAVALAVACREGAPRAAPPPRPERAGPGWRLRGAELEVLEAGVRVVMPTAWRVLTPQQTHAYTSDGVVLAAGDPADPAVYLTIAGRPIGAARPVLAVATLAAQLLDEEAPLGPATTAVIGGQRFTVLRTALQGELHDHAFAHVAGRYVAITLATTAAFTGAARPALEAVLAGTVFLDAAAIDALAADLRARPSLQDEWGPDYADHGERFRDFVGGWTWRHPPGVWRVEGATASPDDPARLEAREVVTGTGLRVSREPWSASVEAYLDGYAGPEDQIVAVGPATLAGHPGRFVEIVAPEGLAWLSLQSRTTAAVIDGHVLALQVANRASAWPGDAWVDAATAALALEPAMVEVDAGPPYRNWRYGVVVDLPRSFVRQPTPATPATVLAEQWRQGSTRVDLEVFSLDSTQGDIADPVARYLSAWPGLRRRGPPARSRVTIDGWPAIRLAWRAQGAVVEATLVERIDTVVELTIQGAAQPGVRVVGSDVLRFLR